MESGQLFSFAVDDVEDKIVDEDVVRENLTLSKFGLDFFQHERVDEARIEELVEVGAIIMGQQA